MSSLSGRKTQLVRADLLPLLIGGLVLFFTFVRVFPGGAHPAYAAEKVKLVHYGYYWHGEAWRQFVDWAATEFEKTHPNIEIAITVAGGPGQGAYDQKFATMVAAGAAPDVAEMNMGHAIGFVAQGVFLDLRPWMAKEKNLSWDAFPPAAVQLVTWLDGTIWGMPIDVYPSFTFFNEDLFNEMGLANPAELGPKGWTWESMLNAAKKLTKDKDGDGNIDQYGIDNRLWAWWGTAVHQAGGQLYDRAICPTRATFNNPAVIQALQFVQDLYWKHKVAVPQTSGTSSTHVIWLGNVGVSTVDGPGRIGDTFKNVKFAWDIAPQPRGPVRGGCRFTIDAIEIIGSTRHPAEAWEWVKFLTTNLEVVRRFVAATGRLPAHLQVQREYSQLVPYAPRHAAYMAYEAANPDSGPIVINPRAAEVNAIVNPLIQQVLDGKASPASVVVEIDEKVNKLLATKK